MYVEKNNEDVVDQEVEMTITPPEPNEEPQLATTIVVPLPNETTDNSVEIETSSEEVDITPEDAEAIEKIDIKPTISPDDEKFKVIEDSQKEYLLKRAKEADINWDEVEFAEDGITPLVTEEQLKIYAAVSNDVITPDFLDVYIEQCHNFISDYLYQKNMAEQGMLDEDDLEYYEHVTKGYEDSRIVLAMLQIESKKIEAEFVRDKIAEKHIKSVTLASLRDFIVEKFRYTKNWNNPDKTPLDQLDKTEEIEDNILKNLYVTPLINGYIELMKQKSLGNPKLYNFFVPEAFSTKHNVMISGLQSYLNNIEDKTNVDVGAILKRDFGAMNFIRAVISAMLVVNDDKFVAKLDVEGEHIENLKRKLNPDNTLAAGPEAPLNIMYSKFNAILDMLMDDSKGKVTKLLDNIISAIEYNLKRNPAYHKMVEVNGVDKVNLKDYKETILMVSELFPQVEEVRIMKWGKYYSFLKQYEQYTTFVQYKDCLAVGDTEENNIRTAAINLLSSVATELFNLIYGDFIDDLNIFVRSNVYAKVARQTVFGLIMNNLIMQHELGFKTDINFGTEEEPSNISGDGLYEFAKKVFGASYEYLVIEKEGDILLKDVDLLSVRESYVNTCINLLDFLSITFEQAQSVDTLIIPPTDAHSNKKSKKKRSRSKRR